MSEEDAYIALANAIVAQAVEDWRKLCKKQEPSDKFIGLRHFLKARGAPCSAATPTRCLYWTDWSMNARQH